MANKREIKLEELIEGCRQQKRRAHKAVYENYFGIMMSICLRYNRNYEDALETLNTGFFKIFTKIDSYSGNGSFEGWMKRIMINTNLDFIKAVNRIPSTTEATEYNVPTVKNDCLDKFEMEEVVLLVQQLPAASRAVFNLYVFENYSHKEIAGALNISEGTSHWHLSNARKILAELVKEKSKKQ